MKVDRRLAAGAMVVTGFLTLLAFRMQPVMAKTAAADWLPLCEKCEKPTIFAESGIGTAHAIAKARVTYQNAVGHCEQWSTLYSTTPTDCDKQAKETLKEETGKVYTATADCVHGKLTIADGENFVYEGLWPAESLQSWAKFMKGRTRWRWGAGSDEDTGKIVGFDGPTRAPMVDAISEILCPSGVGGARKH